VEFRILGPLEVWHDGTPLRVTGDRQRALLAILLLYAGEVVSADQLMDDLWGDALPAAGITALRVRVSRLRKALGCGDDLVAARAHGYVLLVGPGQLDLHRFERLVAEGERALEGGDAALASERLREGLALWRGPPLQDFAYAPFAQAAIARLQELRLAARERWIDAELALGRHAHLVGQLEELVGRHPLRERLHAQLMLALYRDGRQADALAVYRDVRSRLVDEVGIEPAPRLQALERRILAQDPGLDLDGRTPARARSVLVVPIGDAALEALVDLAGPLAHRCADELLVAALVQHGDELAAVTERAHAIRDRAGVTVRVAAFVSGDRGADAVRLAAEQDAAVLVLDAPQELLATGAPAGDLDVVLSRAACDVALVAGCERPGAGGAVVVPFAGHEHDWAAIELGAWLAGARGVSLRLVGTRADPAGGRRDASRLLAHASLALQRGLGVTADPALVEPGADGIVDASQDAAAVVLGLSDRWAHEGLGSVRLAVARRARPPVILVRRGVRPGGLSPPGALTRFTWSASAG
jgi:DNA-binding SARP family transcriptional activator